MRETELTGASLDRRDAKRSQRLPRGLRTCVITVVLAVAVTLSTASGAFADPPPPTPGTVVQCTFDGGKDGRTTCHTTTTTVAGPYCFDDAVTLASYGSPIVVYNVTIVVAVATYAGDVVAGDRVVDGSGAVYYTAVRRHAKLLSDGASGKFYRYFTPVDSC
jgi:hypothetical protein